VNTGSRDERQMLVDLSRIAVALERIARVLEERSYGVTAEQVAEVIRTLNREAP